METDLRAAGFMIVAKDPGFVTRPHHNAGDATIVPTDWLLVAEPIKTGAALPDTAAAFADAYRVQFENAQVKVVRMHYPAGISLPAHAHPAGATLYVYLSDSEGVVFRHSGEMNHVTRRPPVNTGGLRINFGREEQHTAENTSSTPADSLRIQLKTATSARRGGRIPPKPCAGDSATLVEFTSESFEIQ